MEKNSRTILRAYVRPLAVQRRRIVALPEDGEKFEVGHSARIKFHLDSFGVPGASAANILVSRILHRAAGVTGGHGSDAFHLPECVLHTPETSCRECSLSHSFNSLHSILTKLQYLCCHIARFRSSRARVGRRLSGWRNPAYVSISLAKPGREHAAVVRLVCLAGLFEDSFQEARDFEDSLIFHSRGIVAITRQSCWFNQLRNGFIDAAKTVQHNADFVFENPIRVVTLLRQGPCISFHDHGKLHRKSFA